MAASQRLSPLEVMAVADADHDLFSTWVVEISEHEKAEAKWRAWNNAHELLSVLTQYVSLLNRNFVAANSPTGTQLPEVWEPPPRPGEERRPKPRFSAREFARQLRGR